METIALDDKSRYKTGAERRLSCPEVVVFFTALILFLASDKTARSGYKGSAKGTNVSELSLKSIASTGYKSAGILANFSAIAASSRIAL